MLEGVMQIYFEKSTKKVLETPATNSVLAKLHATTWAILWHQGTVFLDVENKEKNRVHLL